MSALMRLFTALAWGRSPEHAWSILGHDIQRGERRGAINAAIAKRNPEDLLKFAYPVGVFQREPYWRFASCFVSWSLAGVNMQPDPDDDSVDLADLDMANLVRGNPRLLALALAINQQITAPESPTGYMALPDRGADDAESTDPRFAEADRCHEVYGRRQMQFYVFFGWVRVEEDLLVVTPTIE